MRKDEIKVGIIKTGKEKQLRAKKESLRPRNEFHPKNRVCGMDGKTWGGGEACPHKGGKQQKPIWLYCQGARAHSAQPRLSYFGSFQLKFILSTTCQLFCQHLRQN